jgi:hypothetical protein
MQISSLGCIGKSRAKGGMSFAAKVLDCKSLPQL